MVVFCGYLVFKHSNVAIEIRSKLLPVSESGIVMVENCLIMILFPRLLDFILFPVGFRLLLSCIRFCSPIVTVLFPPPLRFNQVVKFVPFRQVSGFKIVKVFAPSTLIKFGHRSFNIKRLIFNLFQFFTSQMTWDELFFGPIYTMHSIPSCMVEPVSLRIFKFRVINGYQKIISFLRRYRICEQVDIIEDALPSKGIYFALDMAEYKVTRSIIFFILPLIQLFQIGLQIIWYLLSVFFRIPRVIVGLDFSDDGFEHVSAI